MEVKYKDTIVVGPTGGTVELMEWIRKNGCPVLDHNYVNNTNGVCTLIVSSYDMGDDIDWWERHKSEGKELDGMYRYWTGYCFIFEIDSKFYYATR